MNPKVIAIALISIIVSLLITWVIAPVIGFTALLLVGGAIAVKAYFEGLI